MFPGDCSVCTEAYDEGDHKPRILRCGHTYCTACIECMVDNGFVECPDCHVQLEGTSAAQFPVNHNILALKKKIEEIKLLPTSKKVRTSELSTSSQKAETSNQEEGSETSSVGMRELKKRFAALERKQRELRKVDTHLNQYQALLNDWQEHHMENVNKLYDLMEENKSVLFLLEQMNSRVIAQRAEGKRGKEKLLEMLNKIENVTTAHEAIEVIGQAQLCTQEAEDWAKECQQLFPDIQAVSKQTKVGNHSSIFSSLIKKVTHELLC